MSECFLCAKRLPSIDLTLSTCKLRRFCSVCVTHTCKRCEHCNLVNLIEGFKHDSFTCNHCVHKGMLRSPDACVVCHVAGGCKHGDATGAWR